MVIERSNLSDADILLKGAIFKAKNDFNEINYSIVDETLS